MIELIVIGLIVLAAVIDTRYHLLMQYQNRAFKMTSDWEYSTWTRRELFDFCKWTFKQFYPELSE